MLFESGEMSELLRDVSKMKAVASDDEEVNKLPRLPGVLALHERFTVMKTNKLFCSCSRQKFLDSLCMLSYEDMKEIQGTSADELLTSQCPYCTTTFEVTPAEIEQLLNSKS